MNDVRTAKGFVVGVVVAGAIAVVLFRSREPAPTVPAPPPMPAPMMPAGEAPPPPMQNLPPMPRQPASPREAADQLFNAAMTASEQQDQATLSTVLPQALAAYGALGPLDGDGAFHLAALQLAGGHLAEARATCATLLKTNPGHLLALGISQRAAERAGDAPAARDFAQRLLRAYDAEAARPLPEYQDHQRMLPSYRSAALAAVK